MLRSIEVNPFRHAEDRKHLMSKVASSVVEDIGGGNFLTTEDAKATELGVFCK